MYRAILRTASTGEAFRVLMAICSWADSDGWCHASLAKIAKRARVPNRSNVRRCIQTLQAAGEVEVFARGHQRDPIKERRTPSGGWQPTNLYRVVYVDTLRQVEAPKQPAKQATKQVGSTRLHLDAPVGVVRSASKVWSKRPGGHLLYKSENESVVLEGLKVAMPTSAEVINLYTKAVHELLSDDPDLGGELLQTALENWVRRRQGLPDDIELISGAIEQALRERKDRAATPARKAQSA